MIRPMTRALAPALLLTTALAHAQNMRATIEADGPVGMTQRDGVLTIRNGSTSLVKLRKCTFPEAATLAMPSDAVMLSMPARMSLASPMTESMPPSPKMDSAFPSFEMIVSFPSPPAPPC